MAASLFKTKIAAAFLAAALLLLSGCERQIHEQSEFVLGTVCSINLYEAGSAELYGKLFARLRELNDIFNNYSDTSEISRVNREAAATPVAVSQDFYAVLKTALDFARLTGGAFDPTVGPLVKLWGFGKSPRVPSQEEIEAAQKLVGWQCVALQESAQTEDAPGQPKGFTGQKAANGNGSQDQNAGGQKSADNQNASGERESFTGQKAANDKGSQDQNAGDEQETVTDQNPAAGPTVRFTKSGVRLDLGAIAKGYAADCLVDILRERGVKRASLSLGGNVYVYGKKPGGSLWSVAIRDPSKPGQNAFMLKTRDATVVTSGAYERFFEQDGKTYGHILDPATGFPAQSGLESVTIVSHNSMVADALALAGGFECVLVDASGKAYASKGLKGALSALNGQTIDWLPQ